jgi:hypothetical protein
MIGRPARKAGSRHPAIAQPDFAIDEIEAILAGSEPNSARWARTVAALLLPHYPIDNA